jgi:tetratricopeptide (TPR) repeat protein
MENRKKWIENMLQSQQNDPFLWYALALEHQKEGENAEAIQIFERLLDSHPEYLPTYYQLGKLYESTGQEEKAIDAFTDGKRLAKKNGDLKAAGELSEALMMHDIFD